MKDQETFKIIRVKDTSFSVNEEVYDSNYPIGKTQVRIDCGLRFNEDNNWLIFDIIPTYLYKYDDKEVIFANITVSNVFEISNLKSFITDDDVIIPSDLLITLMGICLSHTRSLFSKSIDGTAFNGLIMPLVNPVEISKTMFPQMFLNSVEKQETI